MWYDKYKDIKLLKELYKCHFTRQETAAITGRNYVSVGTIFRGFEIAEIKKYDRKQLSNWEGLNHARAINE